MHSPAPYGRWLFTREIGYRQAEGIVLSHLAATYRAMSQPGKARRRYQQALAIRRQAGDRHGETETLRDLGDLSNSAGHINVAQQFWRQGLAIAEDLGDPPAAAALRGRLERVSARPRGDDARTGPRRRWTSTSLAFSGTA